MRLLLCLAASLLTAQTPSLYDYFPTGNPADCKPRTQAGLLLSGGGGDVDQAFQWFLRKAGGGDIVVLRASGADGYNKYLPSIAAVDSVESFVVKSRAASFDKFLLRKVRQAEGIFCGWRRSVELHQHVEGHAARGCFATPLPSRSPDRRYQRRPCSFGRV